MLREKEWSTQNPFFFFFSSFFFLPAPELRVHGVDHRDVLVELDRDQRDSAADLEERGLGNLHQLAQDVGVLLAVRVLASTSADNVLEDLLDVFRLESLAVGNVV